MGADYYSIEGEGLFAKYRSIPAQTVHGHWHHLLPTSPGMACDLGAGSGRDADWLADLGWDVIAVEPSAVLRHLAVQGSHPNVRWLDDRLPALKTLRSLNQRFDVVLISAVWMHLPPRDRQRAFRVVSDILAPGGLLVISLRHGPDDDRGLHDVDVGEVQAQARACALVEVLYHRGADEWGRDGVWWETVCFRLPDDGTGSLPLLRHIVVNDDKSSTYKLGLLRALARIAQGAPGMVLQRTEDAVTIPLGLVGLYWLKLYLPLIGRHQLRQHPHSSRGYGFAKADFYALSKLSPYDLAIGTTFYGQDVAAVIGAIRDCCDTIQKMPANFIRNPGTNSPVFECQRLSVRKIPTVYQLNKRSLSAFGEFRIPVKLWQALSQFACWIEPAIVSEWESLITSWHPSAAADTIRRAMRWNEDRRDTQVVRLRVDDLVRQGQRVQCVWSERQLRQPDYAVDHCFPWIRWQNNDLWNLMPTAAAVNANKRDKLPSAEQMQRSKKAIIEWWEGAYVDSPLRDCFFTQAEAALPLVNVDVASPAEVFEGLLHQRAVVRHNQQLAEWTFRHSSE